MSDVLLDTNILIRYFRKTPGYNELLHQARGMGWTYISAITRLEIVRGMRDRERIRTYDLLDACETLPIDAQIADQAGELIRSQRARGETIGDADALIAATALQRSLALLTTNPRHFPMPGLAIYQADETGRMSPWLPPKITADS
jgi:predicted nucleic acid-binding protein